MGRWTTLPFMVVFLLFGAFPSPAGDGRSLRVLLWTDGEGNAMNHAFEAGVEEYAQANPEGPAVMIEWTLPEDTGARLGQLAASGLAPDVVVMDPPQVTRRAATGELFSLDAALAADPEWRSRFPDTALDLLGWRGSTYAAPVVITAPVLYCNTALFRERGLALPLTWADILHAARVFAESGVPLLAFGNREGRQGALLGQFLLLRSGRGAQAEAALRRDGEAAAGVVAGISGLLDALSRARALAPTSDRMSEVEAVAQFRDGKAAMLLSQDRLYANLEFSTSKVRGRVDLVPFPVVDMARGTSAEWIGSPDLDLAVIARSAMKQEAIAFIKAYSTNELQEHFAAHQFAPISRGELDASVLVPLLRRFRLLQQPMTTMRLPFETSLDPAAFAAFSRAVRGALLGVAPAAF